MYRLRELRREDLPVINAWRNRPELIAFLGAPFRFINLEVDVAWFENYMRNRQNAIRCTVLRTEDERILGLVSLTDIDFLNQSAEFHIMIGDVENQDHGAGTFAVRAMVEHAFFHMNLHRVALGVLEDNLRAQHVYEKVGFSREGVARASTFKDGRFVNIYRYAILREDYPPPHPKQTSLMIAHFIWKRFLQKSHEQVLHSGCETFFPMMSLNLELPFFNGRHVWESCAK